MDSLRVSSIFNEKERNLFFESESNLVFSQPSVTVFSSGYIFEPRFELFGCHAFLLNIFLFMSCLPVSILNFIAREMSHR